jgi:hypothetical protein
MQGYLAFMKKYLNSWKMVVPFFDQPEETPGACPEIV